MSTKSQRPLYQIAGEIKKDWTKPYFGAVPYLNAMAQLDNINSQFGLDSAKSIVLYFLSNASTWRGTKAKEIKAELKSDVQWAKQLNLFLRIKVQKGLKIITGRKANNYFDQCTKN